MLSEGGQDRIVLICTSCKQNRLKMQEVDFSSCHSKVSQAGWLRKEIYSPALGKLEVQSQSVGRAMLPLKPLGEDPSLSLPAPGGPRRPWPQSSQDLLPGVSLGPPISFPSPFSFVISICVHIYLAVLGLS